MGLISLGLFIVIAVVIGYVIIWVLGALAPGHPAIIDNLIWVIVVLIVLVTVFRALGGTDVQIPRLH